MKLHQFIILFALFSLGTCEQKKKLNKLMPKIGTPLADPNLKSEKKGKKLAKEKPITDAKVSDYEKDELKGIPGQDEVDNKGRYETGPAPKFPEVPTTSDVTAHESEVNGCRDHPLAPCGKCNRACYGPEHETYLYAYCRKSCGFCNEKTSTFHNYWRLRANSSFTPTWMVKEVEMFHEVDSSKNLAANKSQAYASSYYSAFVPSFAFDHDNATAWYPEPYGEVHDQNQDWIGYEFPIAVRIHSVHIHNDEQFKTAAPQNILVEASDDRNSGFDAKWAIHNTDRNPDKRFRVHECPVLWKKYYDTDYSAWCFRLFSQAKTFEEANNVCEEEGGQLASILSNEQKTFILKDVKVCYKAWIGLHKEDKAYYWLDGSDSTYHNWKEEHYTENQLEKDNCVLIDEEGKWVLENCKDENYFICKQKLYIRPASKPEEVPNPLPYEPEIPPLIFYAPHVTEPVANTKHIPQGVFPDKDGKFPDGSSTQSDAAALTAIMYKLALRHLDEIKGQKPQAGTKPEDWEDPTAFTYQIDAVAKKLGSEMNKNDSLIKPSTNLNVIKLPTSPKLEKPQLDMSDDGVPKWNRTDETDDDAQQGIGAPILQGKPAQQPGSNTSQQPGSNTSQQPQSQQSTPPANIPASNPVTNVNANSPPPNPVQPTKDKANKQQEQNPPTGPQKPTAGKIQPPPPPEGPKKPAGGSVGESGETNQPTNQQTNETGDSEEDDDEDDDADEKNIPKNPSENKDKDVDDQSDESDKEATVGGQNNKNDQKKKLKKLFGRRNFNHKRNKLEDGETESESGSGDSNTENKEINDILNSMNKDD